MSQIYETTSFYGNIIICRCRESIEMSSLLTEMLRCPNSDCSGKLVYIAKPVSIITLLKPEYIPEDVSVADLGFIRAVCPVCGFTLCSNKKERG